MCMVTDILPKKKRLTVVVDVLLFCYLCQSPGENLYGFLRNERERKINALVMWWAGGGIWSSQLFAAIGEFFFFFFFSNRTSYILLQTSSPYISQLESRSRACFTFPSCFTASLSLIYLTYTNKNTPVKGKKPQPVDYHQKCPSQIWQASTRIACHFDTLASLKTKLPR